MRTPVKVHLILLIINTIYAVNYIVAKEIIPAKIGPFAMMFFRALGGFLFFTTLFYIGNGEKVSRKDLLKLFRCSIFGIAINGMLFLKGLSLTTPINASLIMILVPILVMIISYFFLKERFGFMKSIGILCGLFGGYVLITKFGQVNFSNNTLKGDIFIFINASSFATYLVLIKSLTKKYNALTLARWLFTFGLLLIFPFTLPELRELQFSQFTFYDVLCFIFIILFTTCLAYYLYNLALKQTTATVASSYIFLQPLLTTIIALALGKDELNAMKLLGGMFIFVGVALVSFAPKKRLSTH